MHLGVTLYVHILSLLPIPVTFFLVPHCCISRPYYCTSCSLVDMEFENLKLYVMQYILYRDALMK